MKRRAADRHQMSAEAILRRVVRYNTRSVLAAAVLAATMLTAPSSIRAEADALAEVRLRYAAAAYEETLSLLTTVRDPALSDEVDEYRALCLLALNRDADAERAMESLVRRHPTGLDKLDQRPPKFVALYHGLRTRLAPVLATEAYAEAKRTYDAGQYPGAARLFGEALTILRTIEGTRGDATSDLQLLASGFLTLAERRALEPSRLPLLEPEALLVSGATGLASVFGSAVLEQAPGHPLSVTPVAAGASLAPPAPTGDIVPAIAPSEPLNAGDALQRAPAATSVPLRPTASAPAAPPVEPAPFMPVPRVYTAEDQDVVPPVVLEQKLPRWVPPFELLHHRTFAGRIQITIGLDGRVVDAEILQPSHGIYDDELLQAVKHWRYQPASKRSYPVQYRRIVDYVLSPRAASGRR